MSVQTLLLDFSVEPARLGDETGQKAVFNQLESVLKDYIPNLILVTDIKIDGGSLKLLTGKKGSTISIRLFDRGLVTVNIEYYKEDSEEPLINFKFSPCDCELNANALSNEHDFDLLPRPWPSPSPYRRNRRHEVISRKNLYTVGFDRSAALGLLAQETTRLGRYFIPAPRTPVLNIPAADILAAYPCRGDAPEHFRPFFWENNWTKLKWGHMESTSFQIIKELSKSVHLVESSECTKLLESSVRMSLDCERIKLLPTIKRGYKYDVYLTSSDERLLEYDIDGVLFDEQSPFQRVQVVHSKTLGNMLVLDDLQTYESRVGKTGHLLKRSTNRSNFLLLHKTGSAGQPGRVPLIETSDSPREQRLENTANWGRTSYFNVSNHIAMQKSLPSSPCKQLFISKQTPFNISRLQIVRRPMSLFLNHFHDFQAFRNGLLRHSQ
ncbi:Spermine synthase [Eumeta japonica]|uniref:Spermine synthase n=1 Tax=Eumeta variegata TaxID=151549 RepID=A0A4C1W1Y5_EUMVA|nr:Spermine synthase [Eumeta japonica]